MFGTPGNRLGSKYWTGPIFIRGPHYSPGAGIANPNTPLNTILKMDFYAGTNIIAPLDIGCYVTSGSRATIFKILTDTWGGDTYLQLGATGNQIHTTNGFGWKFQCSGSGGSSLVYYSGFRTKSGGSYEWSSDATNGAATADTYLYRDAAGIVAQRNSTTAQTLRVYNTYTDASNYERAVFDWTTTANTLTIGVQAGGTGTTSRTIKITGAQSNNALTIAASGSAWTMQCDSINFQAANGTTTHFRMDNGGFYNRLTLGKYFMGASDDVALFRVAAALAEINTGTAAGAAYLRLNGVAVASLPAASATYAGARGTVTDSNTALTAGIGAVVTGGGSNVVPVFCDGTNWRIG